MDNEETSGHQRKPLPVENDADELNRRSIVIENERIAFKPRIGLLGATPFVIGAVIGSGIFISPKGALKNSGSVGMSLVVWTLCGVLSMMIGLVYAELGSRMSRSGGDYTYIKSNIGSIPAFLISWTQTTISQAGSNVVLALVFVDYLCAPIFGTCKAPDYIRKLIAAGEILAVSITNVISVRFASTMQGVFTILKVAALVVITVGGFVYLVKGKFEHFEDAFKGSTEDVTSFTLAIYSCMWAFGGYTSVNDIAEEIFQPKKNIPRAIVLSLIIIIVIYLTTNVSYFTLLNKREFLSVSAVAFAWGDKVLGTAAIVIPISVMCSVHGALNGGFFTNVRVRFAASRADHLPEVLSFLHHQSRIPLVAAAFNASLSLILLIPGDIASLINLTGFMSFMTNGLSIASLLKMRYLDRNNPKSSDTFRTPIIIPILALLICIFMLVAPFVSNPRIEFIYGIIFVISGLVFYFPFVHFRCAVPGFNTFTMFVQLVANSCPTFLDDEILPVIQKES